MELKGISASGGFGAGPAKIVKNVKDLEKINRGDVMVVCHSNPAFVAGLFKVSAVISENGGTLFHLALLAREAGIPLVSGVKNATTLIKEHTIVTVLATGEEGEINVNK